MSMTRMSTPARDQLRGALEIVAGRADGGADAQPALLVARGKRQPALVHQVARGDQADQPPALVRRAAAS